MMNVALIVPPLVGHTYRGTGTYTEGLYKGLRDSKKINVALVNQKDDLSSFDIVHYPYFDPFFLTLPLLKRKPTIVTVHDLIPLKYPHCSPKGVKGFLKWQIQRYSLLGAKTIVTDSTASKTDIMNLCHIDSDKIHTVSLGVSEEFKVVISKYLLKSTKKKLKLPEEFILYVGDINCNKNVMGLLQAFRLVQKSLLNLHLVLVGIGLVTPSMQLTEILQFIRSSGMDDKVHRMGFIDISDLVHTYNLAKIYIQPSFAEGFGLPVLEAMACGCPVMASNSSSLPEVAGDAGIFFNPSSNQVIAEEIFSLYHDSEKQNVLKRKGLQRVKTFTWEKCADEVIQIYEQVLK